MYNWDKYKRMQCNIEKAMLNDSVAQLTSQHYQQLYKELVITPEDRDIFNDTFLKLTYKFNPQKDFKDQFRWFFKQLKGAYYRDSKCNIFCLLEDGLLNIPDNTPEDVDSIDTDIVTKLKAMLKT